MARGIDTEEEYDAFKSWLTNGSCIQQRMSSGPGQKPFEIPQVWLDLAIFAEGGMEVPDTFAEFEASTEEDHNAID